MAGSPVGFLRFTDGQAATVVVGQADFTSKVPGGGAAGLNGPATNVRTSAGALYISDRDNNRVTVFNSIPISDGTSANFALGQPDLLTITPGTSATELSGAQSPVISGGRLFVADYNNSRIAIYNTVPTASPGTIDVVAGQVDKISADPACTGSGLDTPETVAVVGNTMVVTDSGNNRVLIWNSIPTSDGASADLVLGQADFTSCNAGGAATASTFD